MPEQGNHHYYIRKCMYDYTYLLYFRAAGDANGYAATIHELNRIFTTMERTIEKMAAKKGASAADKLTGDNLRWINRNLTEDEKRDHDKQEKKPSDLGVLLFKVALQGYNVRIAWDAYSKCYQANLVPYQAENPNYGYAISARGATPERSVSLLLYKHYAVFEENWAGFYKAPVVSFEG